MLDKLLSIFKTQEPQRKPVAKFFRARFDAAQTTKDNLKHWAAADLLSADAESSASVRQTLRMRSRYEIANNSYARGIVLTLANDTIGTGPRLQSLTGSEEQIKAVEQAFTRWAHMVNLADKLRTARKARIQDGEAFILLSRNPRIAGPVTLDLQLIEADRVTSNELATNEAEEVDGIRYDKHGNPTSYRVLKSHPGALNGDSEALTVSAEHMIHSFRVDRPGQSRGVPEITPALPLFAQLRRFTLAVIAAAESAANYAGIVYTDAPAGGEADDVEAMDAIELERNTLLTLPAGWKMGQLDPKQPVSTYGEFKREILNEIARCLNMPYNVAAGNSSGYNYASGRLDHQTYYKAIKVDREYIERVVLDRIFEAFYREYALAERLPKDVPAHIWIWDGTEHVDPAKEANAQAVRLANLTTTLAAEYARAGKDWEAEVRQIARERALLDELGLSLSNATQNPDPSGEEE